MDEDFTIYLMLAAVFGALIFLCGASYLHKLPEALQPTIAVVCIVCGASMACRAVASEPRGTIAWVLRAYLWMALGFSGVYYTTYRVVPHAFAFSTAIIPSGRAATMARHYDEAKKAYRRASLLKEVGIWMDATEDKAAQRLLDTRTEQPWRLPGRIEVTHAIITMRAQVGPPSVEGGSSAGPASMFTPNPYAGPTVTATEGRLWIADEYGSEPWIEITAGEPLTMVVREARSKRDYLANMAEIEASEIARALSALRQLRTGDQPCDYSMVDFVYFSLVTVTTLGYGDIVPNSTFVRVMVMAHIVLGLSLILRATSPRHR